MEINKTTEEIERYVNKKIKFLRKQIKETKKRFCENKEKNNIRVLSSTSWKISFI